MSGPSAGARGWDAATYHRVSSPQVEWARPVVERLDLRGDETVLDAGCGSGRVTRMLLERLPHGRLIAVDGDAAMVEAAREALPADVRVIHADLAELELDEPVDAVFSNAVFHWILDHDRLFRRIHAALRPGGRLVAQCGGAGGLVRFFGAADAAAAEDGFAPELAGWRGPWYFATAEETEERLDRVGFEEAQAWLEPWPVTPEDPRDYLRTVPLALHLERLSEQKRDEYVERVLARLGEPPVLDHVRLNINARRPA